ncbi:MAG: hypothetical protein V3T83_10850 [Acidobacteriota bacterium]
MIHTKEQFIVVDSEGKRTAVVLLLQQYKRILDELEELESIRAYEEAKSSGDEAIPFEQAVDEIEQQRRLA